MPKKTKKCGICKEKKGAASFAKDSYRCKPCNAEYLKKYHKETGYYKNDKYSIDGFLRMLYGNMKKRVEGRNSKNPHYWAGKPILPQEVFIEWGKNHPDFLKLFKRWTMAGHDQKLVPSVNRMDSKKGYTLDNMEWITFSQNCSLAGQVVSFNRRRAVYDLLGDKNG